MLGANADADEARGKAAQERGAGEEAEKEPIWRILGLEAVAAGQLVLEAEEEAEGKATKTLAAGEWARRPDFGRTTQPSAEPAS